MNINTRGEIDLTDLKYVESEDYDAVMKGDVLFNNTNSPKLLGKTAYVKQDTNWAYSNHMTRIRLSGSLLNPAWVSCCLHTLFLSGYFSMHCVHHVNQASIGSKILSEKVLIPLPPLPEQHRIVAKIEELFTRLDAGIESLKKIKSQLKRYRHSVLKSAFEGKLTAEWRQAHKDPLEPASVLLDRIKQERKKNLKAKYRELPPLHTSDLPELPDGWGYFTLDYLVSSDKNSIRRGPFGSAIKKDFFVSYGYKVYEQGNVIYNDFDRGSYFIDDNKFQELKSFEIKAGDVLMSCSGTVGKLAVVPERIQPGVINQALLKITLETQVIDTRYFVYLFGARIDEIMLENTRGSAMVNISSVTDLRRVPFPVAPLREQNRIVEETERYLSVADEIEKTVDQSLRQAERLRQSILKHAFEGKLAPQDPNDEPAEKLLERIKQERAKQQAQAKIANKTKRKMNIKQMRLI